MKHPHTPVNIVCGYSHLSVGSTSISVAIWLFCCWSWAFDKLLTALWVES